MHNILSVLYYILSVACAIFSTIMSYLGYAQSAGFLALLLTLVVFVLLMASHIVIQQSRVAGRSLIGGLLILMLGGLFSFVSNFNYLYSNLMRKDVAAETIVASHAVFQQNLIRAQSSLRSAPSRREAAVRRAEFENQLDQLNQQINDPGNPGVGPRAREHIQRLEQIVGAEMTALRQPGKGASVAEVNKWFKNYAALARRTFEREMREFSGNDLDQLMSEIDDYKLKYASPPENAGAADLYLLAEYDKISGDVERHTNALLPSRSRIDLLKIERLEGQLGEIRYSIANGFLELPNPAATLQAAIVSLLVDIVPLIFALCLLRHRPNQRGRQISDFFRPRPPDTI